MAAGPLTPVRPAGISESTAKEVAKVIQDGLMGVKPTAVSTVVSALDVDISPPTVPGLKPDTGLGR